MDRQEFVDFAVGKGRSCSPELVNDYVAELVDFATEVGIDIVRPGKFYPGGTDMRFSVRATKMSRNRISTGILRADKLQWIC